MTTELEQKTLSDVVQWSNGLLLPATESCGLLFRLSDRGGLRISPHQSALAGRHDLQHVSQDRLLPSHYHQTNVPMPILSPFQFSHGWNDFPQNTHFFATLVSRHLPHCFGQERLLRPVAVEAYRRGLRYGLGYTSTYPSRYDETGRAVSAFRIGGNGRIVHWSPYRGTKTGTGHRQDPGTRCGIVSQREARQGICWVCQTEGRGTGRCGHNRTVRQSSYQTGKHCSHRWLAGISSP